MNTLFAERISVRQRTLLALVTISVIFFLFFSYGLDGRDFHWADRDLGRAFNLPQIFQFAGADYKLTGRTPGGAYYYVLWIVLQFFEDAGFIYLAFIALTISTVVIISDWIGREFNWRVAIIFSLAMLGNFNLLILNGKLWNPLVGFPFMLLSLYFTWKMVVSHRGWHLIPAIAMAGIAIQCHISFLYLVPLAYLASVVSRIDRRWTSYVLAFLALGFVFSPYLVYEIWNNFPIYKEGVFNPIVQTVKIVAPPINLSGGTLPGEGDVKRFFLSIESIKYMLTVPFAVLFDTTSALPNGIKAQLFLFLNGFALSGAMLATSSAFGLLFVYRLFTTRIVSQNDRLVLVLLLALLLTLIAMSWTTIGVNARYIMFTIPCGALLSAVALDHFWKVLTLKDQIYMRLLAPGLLLWFVLGIGSNMMSASNLLHISFSPFGTLSERAKQKEAIEIFSASRGFMPSGIAVINDNNNRSGQQTSLNVGTSNSYFFQPFSKRRFSSSREMNCLIIVANKRANQVDAMKAANDLIESHTSLGSKITWGSIDAIEDLFLVNYSLPNGNCLDTVRNYWIYSPPQMQAFDLSANMTAMAIELPASAGVRRFVFKIDKIGQFNIIVDFVPEKAGFRAIIRSYALQNRYFRKIGLSRPRLEYEIKGDPAIHRLDIDPGVPIGTVTPGLETPVRSPIARHSLADVSGMKLFIEKIVGDPRAPLSARLEKTLPWSN
jgi:hypothetical protein